MRQCDPGPVHMCVNCLGHLENWEEFKQKCISSNNHLQEYLKHLEEDKVNSAVDQSINSEDQLETVLEDNNYDSTFTNTLNDQDSNNDSSQSKSPVPIIVMKLLLVVNE